MAIEKRGPADMSEGAKADRRRLAYLKERSKDLKKEMLALKSETDALLAKLGIRAKDAE
jgi:cell division protein FtsB